MIKRSVDFPLTTIGLHNAVKYLKGYEVEFMWQVHQYIRALQARGYEIANFRLADARSTARSDIREDESNQIRVGIVQQAQNKFLATLTFEGKRALFIEFGAGITMGYGHPDALGKYGPGTYNPSSPRWSNPKGWWYTSDSGESRHTYGNQPYAPLYGALERMSADYITIAKQIFI